MKRLILSTIVLLFSVLCIQAQGRDAYSFKISFHFDEDDKELVDSITVDTYVEGVKTYLNFSHRVFTLQYPDNPNIKWIDERDINFDGIPDLMVYLGYVGYGGQGGDVYSAYVYSAYVWNPETRKFIHEEEFEMIPDPEFDNDTKTIRIAYRMDDTTFVRATYKWDGYKLKVVSQEEESIDDMMSDEE